MTVTRVSIENRQLSEWSWFAFDRTQTHPNSHKWKEIAPATAETTTNINFICIALNVSNTHTSHKVFMHLIPIVDYMGY